MKITFLGGGPLATSVGKLARAAGHEVVLGLRNPEKGNAAGFDSAGFREAVVDADVVVVALPYYVTGDVLPALSVALAGKVVIDGSNPVGTDWKPILTGEQSSGAEEIAKLLPRSKIVKAFNTIFADVIQPQRLDRDGRKLTFFVAGDDSEVAAKVMAFGEEIGLAPIYAGPLMSSRYLEAMAHLNIELAVNQGGGTNAAFLYDRA